MRGPLDRACRLLLIALGVLLVGAARPPLHGALELEYKVKAATLYKIAKFVKWPDDAFATARSPFIIAVVGQDPFGPTLDSVLQGKTLHGRKIIIRRLAKAKDIHAPHVLYLGGLKDSEVQMVFKVCRGRPILVAGDSPEILRRGGTLHLFIEGTKLRFQIDAASAKKSNLSLNPRLLGLSKGPSR